MSDIQVVRLHDVLPVASVTGVPGVVPRSVMVNGTGFEDVESVYLNGSLAPEFVVMSPQQILAQVPEDQATKTIQDAYVLSTRLSYSNSSLIELTVGARPQAVRGTLLLVQNFTRMLLRTPGTNIFNRGSGGGLYAQIGKNLGGAREQVGAEVAIAISRTRQLMIATQTPNRTIPAEERLLAADIVGFSAAPQEGVLYMSISVTSHAGITAAATIIK